jgi:TrmH family RNA methyltransferase
VAQTLGAHSDRLTRIRALLSAKGRKEQQRFAFEGPTLLAEARRGGTPIEEVVVTAKAYETAPIVREVEAAGTPVFVVDERSLQKISDLETPPGIVAVSRIAAIELREQRWPGPVLLLADLSDPGNAGTLLRSAEAFGCVGAVFGSLGVDPYHPKVVRSAMGSLFRLPLAVADPASVAAWSQTTGHELIALDKDGEPLRGFAWPGATALVVGQERHGLGRWSGLCGRRIAIPMRGPAESLNAAIAGSIVLYEVALFNA